MVAFSKLVDDNERALTLWRMVASLGSVELVSVPIFYLLGKHDAADISSKVLITMYGCVTIGKMVAVKLMTEFDEQGMKDAVEAELKAPETIPVVGMKLCLTVPFVGTKLCWPKGATLLLTSIPTYCETLTVAFALGSAGAHWDQQRQSLWSVSWKSTPFGLLGFVGYFTLPTFLGAVVSIGYFVHCLAFGSLILNSRSTPLRDLDTIGNAANTAGLMLIATVMNNGKFEGDAVDKKMGAAIVRFMTKFVCGTLLRMYFKISLAGILMNTHADDVSVHSAKLAVVLSFLHAAQIIYQCITMAGLQRIKEIKANPIVACILFLLFAFLLVNIIRFVGVLECESSMFNVSVWRCVGNVTHAADTSNKSVLWT